MAEDSIQAVDGDPRIADAIKFLQFANEADQMRRDMDKKLDKMYTILLDYIADSKK